MNLQSSAIFSGLSPGQFTVYVINELGCEDSIGFDILPSTLPLITDVQTHYFACVGREDSTVVTAIDGIEPYQISIDRINFHTDVFELGITPGTHTLYLRDQDLCLDSVVIIVDNYDSLETISYVEQNPDCGLDNGSAEVVLSGGYGNLQIWFNGELTDNTGVFSELPHGEHLLVFADESNCRDTIWVQTLAHCDLYIPNSFSPNGDGINDIFRGYSSPGAEALVRKFQVFDRWGKRIYDRQDFSILNNDIWWTAQDDFESYPNATYIYVIELEFYTGQLIEKHGEFVLMR